jgi:hypothetical protein
MVQENEGRIKCLRENRTWVKGKNQFGANRFIKLSIIEMKS